MHVLLFESNDLSHCCTAVGRLPTDTRQHFPLRSIVLCFQLVNVHQIKKHSDFQIFSFFPVRLQRKILIWSGNAWVHRACETEVTDIMGWSKDVN